MALTCAGNYIRSCRPSAERYGGEREHIPKAASHTSDDLSEALVESLNTEVLRERFEASLRQIWREPGSLAKDLPRLTRRVTIRTREGILYPRPGVARERDAPAAPLSGPPPPPPTPQDTFREMRALVLALIGALEPEKLSDLEPGLEELAGALGDHTDLEMVVPELTALLGPESRVQRVLNFINQNVVLLGVTAMKEGPCRGLFTKDVRTVDGWRIGIDIFEWVQVHHTRREQSVDMFGDASNHFELDFEVRATFDRGMSDLCSGSLRVCNLECASTMALEKRRELESRLLGDVIIL